MKNTVWVLSYRHPKDTKGKWMPDSVFRTRKEAEKLVDGLREYQSGDEYRVEAYEKREEGGKTT